MLVNPRHIVYHPCGTNINAELSKESCSLLVTYCCSLLATI